MLFPGQSRYQGIQTIGLLNALKTGDPTMDTMLAVFLPIILTKFVEYLSRRHGDNHETWWSRLNFLSKRMYRRTISYTERPPGSATLHDHNRPVDDDSYNSFLIKAIKLYIHEHCKFDPRDLDLELTDALNSNQSKSSQRRHKPRMRQTNRGLHQTSIESSGSSTFAMLEKCSIIQKPVQNKWHEIGKFDGKPVQLLITEAANGGNSRKPATFADAGGSEEEGNSRSIEVRLKSEGLSSVDTFVGEAYEWYLSQLAKEQSDERYFFDLKGFEGRGSHRYPVFGKYTLSDEKTFKSLFSRKCHELLGLIDQFQSKSGKYAVEGYPHKVGLLLHGEPGTGKTSLIKAVAHYTKRHIVNVPLSRIETNNELMTLFFNQRYTAAGQNANQTPKMDFDQVIFVFEDIDAATDVVKRRQYTAGDGERTKRKDIVIAAQAHVPRTLATTSASTLASSRQTGGATTTQSAFQSDDQLNLMGLLNVLDGVVDTPGRMIIMTSNHPEVLDPALIRPGRIDKILELTHLESPDVVAMISHYYETELSSKEQTRVHCAIHGDGETSEYLKLIPANVEQRVMEEETKESMLKWLETERHNLDTKTAQASDFRMKASKSTVTEGTDDLSTSEESNSEQN